MHYFSIERRAQHQTMGLELAAALEGGIGTLLKFVYKVARKLQTRSPLPTFCQRQPAASEMSHSRNYAHPNSTVDWAISDLRFVLL